jgi:hypothetical protein
MHLKPALFEALPLGVFASACPKQKRPWMAPFGASMAISELMVA